MSSCQLVAEERMHMESMCDLATQFDNITSAVTGNGLWVTISRILFRLYASFKYALPQCYPVSKEFGFLIGVYTVCYMMLCHDFAITTVFIYTLCDILATTVIIVVTCIWLACFNKRVCLILYKVVNNFTTQKVSDVKPLFLMQKQLKHSR